jgi:dTDP-4-dehydrorhamnose 3,5-epimerase-like enzyme
MIYKNKNPSIIKAEAIFDNRGSLTFSNVFNFKKIKRFYIIKNHNINFIRAWHAHKYEEKFFLCIDGVFQISCTRIKNFDEPDKNTKVYSWVLSSEKPQIIYIPNGYANGSMNLSKNAKLLIYSTSTLKQSMSDDHRYSWDYWNPWKILSR